MHLTPESKLPVQRFADKLADPKEERFFNVTDDSIRMPKDPDSLGGGLKIRGNLMKYGLSCNQRFTTNSSPITKAPRNLSALQRRCEQQHGVIASVASGSSMEIVSRKEEVVDKGKVARMSKNLEAR